jgi:hypothetical protein
MCMASLDAEYGVRNVTADSRMRALSAECECGIRILT